MVDKYLEKVYTLNGIDFYRIIEIVKENDK
jgi:hypothetical protein